MNWLIFALMLPHLKPKCLDLLFPGVYRLLDIARILSLLVVCGLFLRRFLREKKLPSFPVLALGLMEFWICLVAVRTYGDYVETCSLAVSVMGVALLADLYAHRMDELLTSLMLNYEWMVYANLLSVLQDPSGGLILDPAYNHTPIYFFGPGNWCMYLCIPAVCVTLLYLRIRMDSPDRKHSLLRGGCLIAASWATVLICRPVTTVIAMVVMALVLLLSFLPRLRRCVTFPPVLLCCIAADLAVSVFRVMETSPLIAAFIKNVLKKKLTLTGRTKIWTKFLSVIPDKLWTGIGTPKNGYIADKRLYDHMHNQYFDLLAQGGIPALALFLSALLAAGWKLTVHRKTPSAKIMTAVMAALLVTCIPEVCRHGSVFLLFPLAYHVDKIEALCLSGASRADSQG